MINKIVQKHFTDAILHEACQRYGLEKSKLKLIRGNSNLIFDGESKILRLSHSDIRTFEDIAVEIDWQDYFSVNGLSVARILQSRSGNLLEQIGKKDHFTAVCFEKIDGVKMHTEIWNEKHFKRIGMFVGKMHNLGQHYKKKTHLKYRNWDEIVEFENYSFLAEKNEEYVHIHHNLIDEFRTYSQTSKNFGLIHYDIHHGNYLLSKNENLMVLFDFEMVCNSWYVNDVAAVVYYAKNFPENVKDDDFERRFLNSFWQGYETEFEVNPSEKEWIPKFLLYRDFLVLGFVLRMWDTENLLPNQIKYIASLETSIRRRRTTISM